jgi:hypothetical protein
MKPVRVQRKMGCEPVPQAYITMETQVSELMKRLEAKQRECERLRAEGLGLANLIIMTYQDDGFENMQLREEIILEAARKTGTALSGGGDKK